MSHPLDTLLNPSHTQCVNQSTHWRPIVALVVLAVLATALLTLAFVVTAVAVLVHSSRTRPANVPSEVRAAALRHGIITPLAATALAVPAMIAVSAYSPGSLAGWGAVPGLGLTLAPAIGGLIWVGVHAVGERTWPRPSGAVRTASLRPRNRGRLLKTKPIALATLLAVHAVTLPVYTATASGDGRQVQSVTTTADGTFLTNLTGPYPGPPYVVALSIAIVLLLVSGALVIGRTVGHRPAVPGLNDQDDELLRTMSVQRITGGVQLALGATALGVNGFAANALHGAGYAVASGAALAAAFTGVVAMVLAAASIASAAQGLRRSATPGARTTQPTTVAR